MHRNKKKRNIIIFSLVGVLLCMVAGYAAFQTRLEIKGTSKVTSNWNILITNVTAGTPTGSAENAVAPKWDKLTASMEANLYDKGDAMEYDVTIENQGTIDAKLNDILTNLENSNSEAVLITFSGYAKGEILKAKSTKIIHVKIEYNPEYDGGETSSEVEIDFDYGQNNNEENNPDDQYLLTYDYSTNGGQSVELDKEYMLSGSNVNLDNTATKEGWTFVGWNTDKDAQIGLKEYQMPTSNTTLYAIYSKDLKVTYEKEDTVESIGKNEDACTIYNNETSCEVTLPEINVNDESATIGWYESNNKVGNQGDKYTLKNDITLIAKAEFEPIIQSWSFVSSTDFHNSTYKTNIITATFLDNKDVPDNAVASWDVSANKNRSVMAWIVADESDSTKYHLYIGGDGGVIANKNSNDLFYNFTALTEITFGDNFDTSNVTSMQSMFHGCSNLTTLDVSNWNTSNVTNMYEMFYGCSSLTTLDVSNWNTSNVTNMGWMFNDCSNLTTLDVSDWNTSNVTDMSLMFHDCSGLTELDVSNWNTNKVTDMSWMFRSCSSLTTLDVSNWNTSNVTNMCYMFSDCSNLTTLNVSNWNTSKVTNMSYMFLSCSKLTNLDVNNWNTSNVTNMYMMFYSCSSLTTLDVSNWNTGNVTTMHKMFCNCSSLTKLVLCSFDTNKVTSMDSMFYSTRKLKSIYVGPNWTTENATTTGMFTNSGVSAVTQSDNCEVDAEDISLEISTTSTTNSITVVANAEADSGIAKYEYSIDGGKTWKESTYNTYTFTGLTSGTSYDIKVRVTSNIGKTSNSSSAVITNSISTPTFIETSTGDRKTVTITFPSGCGDGLTCTYQKDDEQTVNVTTSKVEVPFTDSGNVVATVTDGTNTVSSSYNVDMLSKIQSWEQTSDTDFHNSQYKEKISTIETVNNINIPDNAIISWDISEQKNGNVMAWIINDPNSSNMYKLYIGGYGKIIANEDASHMFYDFTNVKNIDLEYLDTSNTINMYRMFENCESVESINLSNFNTENVTSMRSMFNNCYKLKEIDLSKFNTPKLSNTGYMFMNCRSITNLDLSNLNTSNVTDMTSMFNNCLSLTSLNLNGLNTSKVTTMNRMFYDCRSLVSLNLSSFNTSNVTDMTAMFSMWEPTTESNGETALETIIFGTNFNTSKVTTMEGMFNGCSKLTSINLSGFDTSNVTNMRAMFQQCSSLTSLNVSSFNTAKVTNMNSMFNRLNITSLDLSSFNTRNVTEMGYMFTDSSKLKVIYVGSNWSTAKADTTNMFTQCGTSSVTIK